MSETVNFILRQKQKIEEMKDELDTLINRIGTLSKENYELKQALTLQRDLKFIANTLATSRLGMLREGLDATKLADGHWSDRVRWMNWVDKVEKELGDE